MPGALCLKEGGKKCLSSTTCSCPRRKKREEQERSIYDKRERKPSDALGESPFVKGNITASWWMGEGNRKTSIGSGSLLLPKQRHHFVYFTNVFRRNPKPELRLPSSGKKQNVGLRRWMKKWWRAGVYFLFISSAYRERAPSILGSGVICAI